MLEYMWTRERQRGFTITELIIVIVAIAILATIGIVSYSNVQRQARNAVRLKEVKDWVELVELYYHKYKHYPGEGVAVDGGACLGTGFPLGTDGKARCRERTNNPGYSYKEEDSVTLMNEFKAIADIPTTEKIPAGGDKWLVGPWIEFHYNEWGTLNISTAIDSDDPKDCEKAGFLGPWGDGNGTMICTTQNLYNGSPSQS